MNTVKFLFSLYESSTGERIVTTSVKGEMAPVLKEISDLIKHYETTYGEGRVVLKTLKLQTEDRVIVDPVKMDSLSTLLFMVSEHYKQQTGTTKLMVENSTPKKNSILENLKKVLNNPSKMAKLVAELDLHEMDTKYHEVARQHGLTWKRGGPDSGDYEGRHHTLYSKAGGWAVHDNRGNEIGKGNTKASAHKFLSTLKEIELPSLDKGDILLVGKFKNRRAEIEGFDTDEHGQPIAKTTKGDQKIFKPRIEKLIPENQRIYLRPGGAWEHFDVQLGETLAEGKLRSTLETYLSHIDW